MGALGIIICQSLELEFAYVMANDPDVKSVYVLRDHYSTGFEEGILHFGGSSPQLIHYLPEYPGIPADGLEVVVRVLKIGLHKVIREVRDKVVGAAEEMGPHVDAILIGYGLCGNALDKPDELFAHVGVPVLLPMEEFHPVDDCVGLIIGGRENYYEEQCKCAGTWFMNSGFARHWKTLRDDVTKGRGDSSHPELLKRYLAEYKRTLLLPTPVMSEEELADTVADFNESFGLHNEVRPGTLDLLYRAWNEAKQRASERKIPEP
ncbi:DUF1638 domain-containing protein [Thermodesulfobacteriota bacterium]